ncbi:MAG: ATP-binding cassette domain-containing protein, partial [Ichthyobacteriaceae bacterium]|nr:ATP-binding cassette domain-containing protein [Ichthyobacteriaceae bacterium]
MIIVDQITKKYGNQKALNNVSFSINKGEIIGLLGPNGAGKSTLMKLITSQIAADNGDILIDNINVSDKLDSTKKTIGFLPENNALYTEMYVIEYLEFIANLYNIDKKEIKEVVIKTGLSNESHKKIAQLSKGYKQRVGLAAAIIHNPKYLILDEPTTGLDPNQLTEIRQLIKDFGKDKTIILSTHIMQEVEAMCDRVIILNKGEIVKDDYLINFNKENQNTCKLVLDKEINIEEFENIKDVTSVNRKSYTYSIEVNNNANILKDLVEITDANNAKINEYKVSEKTL